MDSNTNNSYVTFTSIALILHRTAKMDISEMAIIHVNFKVKFWKYVEESADLLEV